VITWNIERLCAGVNGRVLLVDKLGGGKFRAIVSLGAGTVSADHPTLRDAQDWCERIAGVDLPSELVPVLKRQS